MCPVRRPAELPVSHNLQADGFLHLDHVANRVVLYRAKVVVTYFTGLVFSKAPGKICRPQQATDVFGPNGWPGIQVFRHSGLLAIRDEFMIFLQAVLVTRIKSVEPEKSNKAKDAE
jgi:hypothetical protein